MNDEDGVQAVADEIRHVAEKPGMVSVFLRPNPSVDWRPFNDKVYDPVGRPRPRRGSSSRSTRSSCPTFPVPAEG